MAFKISPDEIKATIGYVQCQMVLNIKMKDFRHETRHVVGCCMTKVPATINYASVASREVVRIALMVTISMILRLSQVKS